MTSNCELIHQRERIDYFGIERSAREYPPLKSVLADQKSFRKLRICIVTQDFVGPVKNGGIGTAYMYVARALASAGHVVTVLYTISACAEYDLAYWVKFYKKMGISFVPVDKPSVPIHHGPSSGPMRINYHVYEWLKQREDEFDIVHASEWRANIYLCLLAKQAGLYFRRLQFVVKASSPTLWSRIGNSEPVTEFSALFTFFMERRTIELADHVTCGGNYLLNWMTDHGYQVPHDKCFVQPNIFPTDDVLRRDTDGRVRIEELVFFGRLEPRKGIHIFVDALMQLKTGGFFDSRPLPRIVFLGKFRKEFDTTKLLRRLETEFEQKVEIISDMSQPQALDYLSTGAGRVAVMPSLVDNSPFVVYECLSRSIPFIASMVGGGKELVHRDDWSDVMFYPTPVRLRSTLESIFEQGCPVPRPSFDFHENIDDWLSWHLWVADQNETATSLPDSEQPAHPLVSVCIAHHNRGQLLLNALESVLGQDYDNIEIVIVDDGSTEPDALRALDEIETGQYRFPIRVVRQSNNYLGAVRNTAARNARGEYILFMDDDNEAKPHEVSTFVEVALHTDSAIVTCFSDSFSGDRPAKSSTTPRRIVYHGQNLAMGLFGNPYGDSNSFVRKSDFESLGGFTEHYKVGLDDAEFFSRAILSGIRTTLIPEALFWYRLNPVRMRHGLFNLFSGPVRVSETYVQGMHPDLANILRYAQGMAFEYGSMNKAVTKTREAKRRKLPESIETRLRKVVAKNPLLYRTARFVYRKIP